MRRPAGFTLIELLVVVAIMGIMALVAMPASGTGYDQRLDLVELQITDAVSRAQALARSTRSPHGVRLRHAHRALRGRGTPAASP